MTEKSSGSSSSSSLLHPILSTTFSSTFASSLSIASWIGIAIGIFLFVLIVVTATILYFKRRQYLTISGKQSASRDSKLHSNVYTTIDRTNNPKGCQEICNQNEYEEIGTATKSEMTVNMIYNDFEQIANKCSKHKQTIVDETASGKKEACQMTVNVLYDEYRFQNSAKSQQNRQNGSSVYANPFKKHTLGTMNNETCKDLYSFAENITDGNSDDAGTSGDAAYSEING